MDEYSEWVEDYKNLQDRLGKLGLSDQDYVVISTALASALEGIEARRELHTYYALMNECSAIASNDSLSESRRGHAVLEKLNLDKKSRKKRHTYPLADGWRLITEGGGYIMGNCIAMQTSKSETARLVRILKARDIDPVVIKTKRDALLHITRIYRYQSSEACLKALQRAGVKGLPSTWPEA